MKSPKFSGTEGVGYCDVSLVASCNKNQVKRLLYRFPTTRFSDRTILSATFVGEETYAYDCDTDRGAQLWRVNKFGSSVTWNSSSSHWLSHLQTRSVSYCSKTGVEFGGSNVKDAVQSAADAGNATISFGLQASSESSMAYWKRFADDAYLTVKYDKPPAEAKTKDLSMSPGGECSTVADKPWVNQKPMLYAELHDPDGDQIYAQFKVWWTKADGSYHIWTSSKLGPKASGGLFDLRPDITFPSDKTLAWAVRVWDGYAWSPWSTAGSQTGCYFRYDATRPAAPTVTSTDYPESNPDDPNDPWIDGVGRYGSFTIASNSSDVIGYKYKLRDGAWHTVKPSATGGSVKVSLVPQHAGPNYLTVEAYDEAGNYSVKGEYIFRVKAGDTATHVWHLDDAQDATSIADSAGGLAAAPQGGVTLGVDGVQDTAMQVNGTDAYAATSGPAVDTGKSFAVSAWAKLPASKPDHSVIVVTQAGTSRSGFELYYSQYWDRWAFDRYDADTSDAALTVAKSDAAPAGGRWAHLVGVYDHTAKTIALYVNGSLQQAVSFTSPWNAAGDVLIGAGWYGAPGNFFSGAIDDVRTFDRMVTASEVRGLYRQRPWVSGRWALNDSGDDAATASGYYKLDDAAGAAQAADSAGSAPAGVHGGVTFGATGKVGGAARLDGSSGYLATSGPVLNTSQSFSVSAWARLPATKPDHSGIVVTQAGTNRSGFELYYSAYWDRWVFSRYSADTTTATNVRANADSPPALGAWTHLVGVYDASAQTITLFVNGVRQHRTSFSTPWNAAGGVQIGAGWYGHTGNYFAGTVDDVRLYQQALTGSQAAVLAGSPSTVTADDSALGNHALLHGDAHIDDFAGWVGDPPAGLVLDGAGDFAATSGPVVDTAQSFTVAGWVTTAGKPDHRVAVFSQAGSVNSGFELCYDPAAAGGAGGYRIIMAGKDTSGADEPSADNPRFQLGTNWDHVAIVYDAFADEMRLYVNGQLEQTEDQVSWRDNVIGFNATKNFEIGRALDNGTWGQYWPGVIDDVWAWHGTLTDAQIQKLAVGNEEPTYPGP